MIECTLLRVLPWRLGLQLLRSYLMEDFIHLLCTCHPLLPCQAPGCSVELISFSPACLLPPPPTASCTLWQPNELKTQSQPGLLITITFHFLQINPAQNKSRTFWAQPLLWMFNHNILVGPRLFRWLLSSNLWYTCLVDDVTAYCCCAFLLHLFMWYSFLWRYTLQMQTDTFPMTLTLTNRVALCSSQLKVLKVSKFSLLLFLNLCFSHF
jgi:hypothetical protein